jgi:uncharacterized repeat protein (TIGR02543 family)
MKIKATIGIICCLTLSLFGCGNTIVTHSIVYDGNASASGTAPIDANAYANGQTATVLGNTGSLVKSPYTFSGWNTEADGSGTKKLPGASLRMGSSDIVLYAQWGTKLSVAYDGNGNTGGSVPTDGNAYSSGHLTTVLGNSGSLAKTGYSFSGWNTEADGSGSVRTPGTTFAIGSMSVTLYAQWTARSTYSVTYDGNGQTSGSAPVDTNDYLSGATATVLGNTGNLAKTGYLFAGWNTRADGTGSARVAGTSFTVRSENVALYAQWRPYSVGDVGPAGGLVFYDKGSFSDGWRYLEAAPADQSTGTAYGRSTGSATSSDIGSGKANTYYLMSHGMDVPAAQACWLLDLGGYSDWFLPSLDELNLMFTSLYLNGLGGFTNLAYYWSSTEPANNQCYAINFRSGEQIIGTGLTARVRAARAF